MKAIQTVFCLATLILVASTAGCGTQKKQAQAAMTEWGKVQDLCKDGKNEEAAVVAEKLCDENPVFDQIVYESIKNEPGYPGDVNWCSPMLGGKILLDLMNKME